LNLCDHHHLLLTPGYVKAATAVEKQIGIGIEREREREAITTKYRHKTQRIKQNRTKHPKKKTEK
jgi:hypothetical protein